MTKIVLTPDQASLYHQAKEPVQICDTQGTVLLSIADDAEVDLSFLQLVHAARLHAAAEGRTIALDRPAGGNLLSTLERAGFLFEADPRDREFWLHRKEQQ